MIMITMMMSMVMIMIMLTMMITLYCDSFLFCLRHRLGAAPTILQPGCFESAAPAGGPRGHAGPLGGADLGDFFGGFWRIWGVQGLILD